MIEEYKVNGMAIGQTYIIPNIDKTEERVLNYFEVEQRTPKKVITPILKNLSQTITIIKHIEIYPKFRKKGYGGKLLKEIINKSSGDVVLIAEQALDFLTDWYISNGFEIVGYSHNLPILVLKK